MSPQKPTLTHFRFCPHSRAIRLVLAELAIEPVLAEMSPWEWSKELLALNPSGDLPVLQMTAPGEGAGPILRGSYAIAEFLAATNPTKFTNDSDDANVPDPQEVPVRVPLAPLFPGSAIEQAEVRRLVDWFHGKLHREVTAPLLESHVVPMFKGTAHAAPEAETLRAVRANLAYHLTYLAWLADHRNWLAGSELSFADLAAGAHVSCLDYLGEVDWARFPAAKDWYQRLKSRRSFQSLLADRVPGRPPAPHYADLDF